ncbi:hypothetical protein CASFOL_022211 [Castilleja foliolosa]|uniref:Uncharacterized protein n=1 Tax=Castilleja foliolosa TaxID=1961234 RepID=A0ABD3CV79_9LAMI
MNNENISSCLGEPTVRITRARAKALGSSGRLYPSTKQDDKVSRTNAKRAASGLAACRKKRTVLKDVTNITHRNARDECNKRDKEVSLLKNGNASPSCLSQISRVSGDKSINTMHDTNKLMVDEIGSSNNFTFKFVDQTSLGTPGPGPVSTNENLNKKDGNSDDTCVIDIDSKHNDPQMCIVYAADIYYNMYAAQLARRPLVDYIEKVQRDITQDMRAILIDWLVEVSDEYRMASDTLYLTVNLIDRFLSKNYIEKQTLQLLGITCMLIATKYEEICAPRVEEFCFITDNTYTKDEVVQMESRVLNFVGFQLCVPTTKKFLRRFVQAAQVSYEVFSVELEFLANYLAELTLIDYNFLKFLPSLIAASAVFLARWTLDHSQHPWNATLEHYSRHKTSELKITILQLQELQLNTRGCAHNVIREKYKQPKSSRAFRLFVHLNRFNRFSKHNRFKCR